MSDKIESYISKCFAFDKPDDPALAREEIMRRMLRYAIKMSQQKYLQHLRSKVFKNLNESNTVLGREPGMVFELSEKANGFLNKILRMTLR
jgi:hypothetical protein